MVKNMKLKALSWAHRVVSSLQKTIETHLNKQLDPFTSEDFRDEVMNRYPY